METIYKYGLSLLSEQEVLLPVGSKILSVQFQRGALVFWALIDTEVKKTKRVFTIYGTGHSIANSRPLKYIATVQQPDSDLVWHIFEDLRGYIANQDYPAYGGMPSKDLKQ